MYKTFCTTQNIHIINFDGAKKHTHTLRCTEFLSKLANETADKTLPYKSIFLPSAGIGVLSHSAQVLVRPHFLI